MKATAHWLELKGHTQKSLSTHFDEEFTEQVIATGKIEEGRLVRGFFKRSNQRLLQKWLVETARRLVIKLPFMLLAKMGLATIVKPRVRSWDKAREAIKQHVAEQSDQNNRNLNLDELVSMARSELDKNS